MCRTEQGILIPDRWLMRKDADSSDCPEMFLGPRTVTRFETKGETRNSVSMDGWILSDPRFVGRYGIEIFKIRSIDGINPDTSVKLGDLEPGSQATVLVCTEYEDATIKKIQRKIYPL